MPYDATLDKECFKESKEMGDTRVTIGIFSYNGGEKKLQLTRENRDSTGEWRFTKLGRMSQKEVKEILPIMLRAAENMQ